MFSLFILRMVAWSYPLGHAWLWWSESVNLFLYLGCFFAAMFLSSISPLHFKSIKQGLLWAMLLIFPPFVLRFSVELAEALLFSNQPTLLALFDFSFIPSMVIMLPFFVSNYLARCFKSYLPFEFIIRLILFIASFWATEGYRLLFYPNHALLIIFLSLYLIIEATIFILASEEGRGKSALMLTLVLFILPSLIVIPYIFSKISGQMVKYSGGLLEPTLSGFDFSKNLPLESEIDLGSDLILLLKVDPPLDSKQLFKRYTLAGYSSSDGFYQLDGYGDIDYIPATPVTIDYNGGMGRRPLEQEVYLVSLEKKALIAAQQVEEIIPYQRWNASSFKGVYRVYSMVNDSSSNLLDSTTTQGLSPDEMVVYLAKDSLPAVEALAEQLTAGLTSPYQKAEVINSFLRYNYHYSLRPGKASTGSQIEHFLFESQKGYCSYFAYSMALMLRYLDIPTRVATGFWADPTIEELGYYPIQSNLAHAWVEVYFDDYGWVNFDPTSDLLDPYELSSGASDAPLSDMKSLVDEINNNRLLMLPTDVESQPLPKPIHPLVKPAVPRAISLFIAAMLLFCLFGSYILIILRMRWRLKPMPTEGERVKSLKMCYELYFYNSLRHKNLTFILFLARYENIAILYRRARYSHNFSHNDYISMDACYQHLMHNSYGGLNIIQKIGLLLNPRQFFVKASYHE